MNVGDVAQLAIALTALAAAIYAIRRDRPVLRARWASGAAGTVIVSIVNVGLRAVRVERLIRREGWIRPRDRDYSSWTSILAVTPLPVIVEPGHEVIVPIANEDMYPTRGRWFLEDAAGRRHAIKPATSKYIPTDDETEDDDIDVASEVAGVLTLGPEPSPEATRNV